jgi:hypothetical protein
MQRNMRALFHMVKVKKKLQVKIRSQNLLLTLQFKMYHIFFCSSQCDKQKITSCRKERYEVYRSRLVDRDPDSVTLWIRIRIGNPDPDPGARK